VVHILTASLAIFFAHAQQPGPGISRQLLVWKDSLERPSTEDRVKRELIDRIFDNRDHLWPDTLLPNVLARLSYHAVDLTDDSLFLAINREARFVARAFRDTLALGSTTWDLGWYHEKTLQRDSAYYYFFLAKDLYQAREDLASTASLYRKMAAMQNLLKDYAGAEANLVEAIRISEIIGDREGLFRCYQMLGTNLKDQGIYP
jgi:tetratricopeptide (TPR) repeat protein